MAAGQDFGGDAVETDTVELRSMFVQTSNNNHHRRHFLLVYCLLHLHLLYKLRKNQSDCSTML